MKSTFISKENNDAKFTMEFTAEEFENAVVKVYKAQKDKFNIDGFRKGKAPRSIIEKKFGEGIFFEDALNDLFTANYPVALGELDLNVIDNPRAEFGQVKKGEGVTVTITVECYPEIEIKDYKGVEIEAVSSEVTDEDIDNEIKSMARKNARIVAVERPAQDGDTVILDYEGWVGDNQFDGGTAESQSLKLGSGMFIPGFEEQLVGVSAGESKDVKVTFPEEYHAEDLAGKEAVFKCVVHEVKEEQLPEINDEFVKDVSEFDTMDELKEDVKGKLEKSKAATAEIQMKNSVIKKVYEGNDIDVPDTMVEHQVDSMVEEFSRQLQSQGLDINTYLKYLNKELAEFRTELKDEAFKKVKTQMIVTAVADQEKFEVSEEELNTEIENMAKQYGLEAQQVREMLGAQYIGMIAGDLKVKKAIEFMYDSAVKK